MSCELYCGASRKMAASMELKKVHYGASTCNTATASDYGAPTCGITEATLRLRLKIELVASLHCSNATSRYAE